MLSLLGAGKEHLSRRLWSIVLCHGLSRLDQCMGLRTLMDIEGGAQVLLAVTPIVRLMVVREVATWTRTGYSTAAQG